MKAKLLVVVLMLMAVAMRAQVVVSDFATNADGWTCNGQGNIVTWTSPGFITGTDYNIVGTAFFRIYWNFSAPAKFTGNKSAYYNGTLSFDLQEGAASTYNQTADVIISAGTTAVYYYNLTPAFPAVKPGWSTYTIDLNELSTKWKTSNSATGAAATASDIQFAMTNSIQLAIRGRYGIGTTTGSLDNVKLTPYLVTTQLTPQTVCAGTTVNLTTATSGRTGMTYQWQIFSPAFGQWVSLTNTAVYSGVTSQTMSINTSTGVGAGSYRCQILAPGAVAIYSNAATVVVNPAPAAPGGSGGSSCGPAAIVLNATGGTAGQYRWYTVPTGGTAIPGQTNSSYNTGVISATTIYYVALNNGTCDGPRTALTATINTLPGAPTTTGASSCTPSALTLNAFGGSAGQYRWYTVPTGGTPIPGQTNSAYTTLVLSTTTVYYVSVNNGACEGGRTAVTAQINSTPGAPGGTGGSSCGPATITLNATGASAGQYRWYSVATGGTPISGQTNSAFSTGAISATITYYVAINNGSCEGPRTALTATINPLPGAPGVTGASSCVPAALTLTASGGSPGQYRWYTVSTGGTPISGQTNSTYTTPVLSSTVTYYVSINNGSCEGARSAVSAQVGSTPSAPTTGGAGACGAASQVLSAFGGSAGQYRWYTVASGGTPITGVTDGQYTTPVLAVTTTYYVALANGPCESPRSAVSAEIYPIPNPPTVVGASGCGSAISVVLKASGGTAGQYRWYTQATGGSAIGEVSDTYTTPELGSTTTFYVAINNGPCESARVPVVATVTSCDLPPAIASSSSQTQIDATITIDLISLLSDPEDNINLNSLRILVPPASGAAASIDASHRLIVDYKGISFSGTDSLKIEVCDDTDLCAQQEVYIDVVGDVQVYNGISPNTDGKNEIFLLKNIEALEATKKNHVSIFNRWGDNVFEVDDYNNDTHVFRGISKDGKELPPGTYFYKIDFTSGKKTITGFLALKR